MAGRPLTKLRQLSSDVDAVWKLLSSLRDRYPQIDDCASLPEDLDESEMTYRDHLQQGMGELGMAHVSLEAARGALFNDLVSQYPDRREELLAVFAAKATDSSQAQDSPSTAGEGGATMPGNEDIP